MEKPQMVLFDYGQTLISQAKFDGVRGTAEVLKHAVKNKYDLSAEQVQVDNVFWDAAAPGTATEGIEEFLHQAGIRTGVISNLSFCGKALNDRINRVLPENYFEFIIATSEYLYRKPHERIFRLALEKAELKPEQVWYIGDDYNCDVVGARNAGLYPIWYRGAIDMPYEDRDDVTVINHWNELKKILVEL